MVRWKLTIILLIAVLHGSCNGAVAPEKYRRYEPVSISYFDLIDPENGAIMSLLKRTLTEIGLVSISGVPGLLDLRQSVLSDAAGCAAYLGENDVDVEHFLETAFQDGTIRRTFGFSRRRENEDESVSTAATRPYGHPSCERFLNTKNLLRGIVKAASHLFISRLDEVCETQSASGAYAGVQRRNDKAMKTIRDISFQGDRLDHFHVYNNTNSTSNSGRMLKMHVDQGLFAAFTPAMEFSTVGEIQNGKLDRRFLIELASGEVVRPEFANNGNAVVFMLGDGAVQYFNKLCMIPLRAVPHAVETKATPTESEEPNVRVWFGSMFLPPMDTLIGLSNTTMKESLHKMLESDRTDTEHMQSFGCSKSLIHAELGLGGCAKNEIFCWTQCMPLSETVNADACNAKGMDLVCADAKGNIWQSGMCTQCKPKCQAPKKDDGSDGFCSGVLTVMFTEGFTKFGKDPSDACLVFLFDFLVIDNWTKYYASALCAFAIGMMVEYVVHMRRKLQNNEYKTSLFSPAVVKTCMHLVQVVLGYFAMLIAMTFSSILFIATVLGISFGHYIFNYFAVVTESDVCCQYMDPPTPDPPQDECTSSSFRATTGSNLDNSIETPLLNHP